MHQRMPLRHVVDVGRRAHHRVHLARISIDTVASLMPKCHWLPFLVWCISGSRSPLLLLVELRAAISVASTTLPLLRSKPLVTSLALTLAGIC
jgi:hypothetical protein